MISNVRPEIFATCVLLLAVSMPARPDQAKPLTAAQVKAIISSAHPGSPPNLAGRNLSRLDLTGVAFRAADLSGANLLEAILINADLSGARLPGANLSSVRMEHADLSKASLRAVTFLTTANGVNFRQADLSRASGYLIAPDANFSNAIIRNARLASDLSNQPMGLLHTILARANLSGADLSFSDLSFSDLDGANFHRANLAGVKFRGADLSAADFTAANVTDADFSQADLSGTIFAHIRGRASMKGLQAARNLDQAIFRP